MKRLLIAWGVMIALTAGAYASEVGDDGLHKAPWMRDTFKDLSEDLEEANAEGKRLMVIIEQRGCIYCKKMHEDVFPLENIATFIDENFFVVQINMFGDLEVTDFDGETLVEKDMVKKWGALFTPMIMFFPSEVAEGSSAAQASAATMPGAFGRWTTFNMLNWVVEEGYNGEESFQRYHARKFADQAD
jgi:thioredoxin-related protein